MGLYDIHTAMPLCTTPAKYLLQKGTCAGLLLLDAGLCFDLSPAFLPFWHLCSFINVG
eukprot:m.43928 g.43928  ORF g.43928 m.43928 type:complete len:58 (+) comp15063_c0_seq2:77-250(+)